MSRPERSKFPFPYLLRGTTVAFLTATLLIMVSLGFLITPSLARTSAVQSATSSSVSPLIFGTNLVLMDASDRFLTDATLRSDMQQIHTQIVRIPTRPGMPES